jgi:WD40 repeat protein
MKTSGRKTPGGPKCGSVSWETVHVFVSSTFNDMHGERDYLVKEVFPELRDWCEARKLRLVDIDLRWGVTETDATRNRNVVQVCLDRVDKARPFFICFLGQRYGWVPKNDDIASKTFESFAGLGKAVEQGASVTEMEVLHALLRKPFDQGQGTRLSAEYAFFYLRQPGYLADVPTAPSALRRTYTDEAEPDADSRESLVRRQVELRKTVVEETNRTSRSYDGKWIPAAFTPELALPFLCPSTDEKNRDRWRKQWKDWAGVGTTDRAVAARDEAKARDFNARLCAGRLEGFTSEGRTLGEVILDDLKGAILARYPERKDLPEQDDLEQEIDRHEDFVRIASEVFIERTGDFTDLDAYAAEDSRNVFVLVAKAGMGKSTLLAKWVERWRSRKDKSPDETIHARFVGVGKRSSTVDSLLGSVLEELRRSGKLTSETPENPNILRSTFLALLGECGRKGRTIVVIDALNQLQSGLADLEWLARSLPKEVKLLVSFKLGDEKGDSLAAELQATGRVTLSEVRPFRELRHRRDLVAAYLKQYLKELDEQHLEALIQADGAENPLFLKIVLTELRVFGAFAQLGEKIKREFGTTPQSGFDAVLRRLESDSSYATVSPRQAVPLLFGLLAHSRGGLTEDLLMQMFHDELGADERHSSKTQSTIRLVLRQVQPFLARRDGRTDFFYEAFQLAARTRYAGKESDVRRWHSRLGHACQRWAELEGAAKQYALANLVHHEVEAGNGTTATAAMTSFAYHYERLKALGHDDVANVTADFEITTIHASAVRDELDAWKVFHGENEHLLRRKVPDLAPETYLLQLAVAHAETSPVTKSAEKWLESAGSDVLWLWSLRRPRAIVRSACIRTFEGHTGIVSAVAVLPDGRAISGSSDSTIRLWDLETGRCLRTLYGHADSVTGVAVLPDGHQAISGSNDKTLRLWDIETGACLRVFDGFTTPVNAIVPFPDGHRALLNCGDHTFQLWDIDCGRCLRKFDSDTEILHNVVLLPDSKRALSADNGDPKLWDLDTGECLFVFPGQNSLVCGVAVWPDGSRAISAGSELKIWDLKTGACLRAFEGQKDGFFALRLLPDGRSALTAGGNALKVWDLETGACMRTFVEHAETVNSVVLLPDGKRALSGSWDKTLKLWDLEAGSTQRFDESHTDKVKAVAILPNCRRAISGGDDSALRFWNLDTGKCVSSIQSGWARATVVAMLPNARHALSVEYEPTLTLWDLETGKPVRTFKGHTDGVGAIVPFPDSCFALSRDSTALWLWNLETGQCVRKLDGHKDWSLRTDKPQQPQTRRQVITSPPEWVAALALLPGERQVLLGCSDNVLRLWDLDGDKCIRNFVGHAVTPVVVAVLPGGQSALSADVNGTVKVWNIRSGQCEHTLEGHTDAVGAVALLPDGDRAISASRDNTLRMWDLTSGQCLAIWQAAAEVLCCAAGTDLIVAGTKGGDVLFLRPLPPGRVAPETIAIQQRFSLNPSASPVVGTSGGYARPVPRHQIAALIALPNLLERPIILSGRTANVAGVSPGHPSPGGDTSWASQTLERPITLSGGSANVAGVSPAHPSPGGDTSCSPNIAERRPRMPDARVAITEIATLLDCGQVGEAIAMLEGCHQPTLPQQNALGVCYLRVERLDDAASTLRPLATERGSLHLRDDVPESVKANFTTAILLSGDLGRGESLLDKLDDKHP